MLGLKAVNCQSGDTLAQEQVTAASKEKVLDALGEAASKLRGELGESLATVQKFDVPLDEATTSSLEALKAYSLGEKGSSRERPCRSAALPSTRHRARSEFCHGLRGSGQRLLQSRRAGRASEYFTKAFQLREHASEREKLTITADYYPNVTGELDKAAQTYQEEIAELPARIQSASRSGQSCIIAQGQYEKASGGVSAKASRLAPDDVAPIRESRQQPARLAALRRSAADQSSRRKRENWMIIVLHNALYALAFLGRILAAMAEQQQWFAGKPDMRTLGCRSHPTPKHMRVICARRGN